jgi:hypothetical protein
MPCGSGQTAHVYLGGVEVTDASMEGGWTPRLNRPAQATVKVWMDASTADCGDLMKITLDDGNTEEIVFHGRILNTETDTAKDGGTTVFNAQDAMELWQYRVVRADDGDFSKAAGGVAVGDADIIADYVSGALILEAMLKNTEGSSTAQGNPALAAPTDAEGPTGLTFGSFAGGGTPMYGAPVDWPMTIAEFWSLLVSTGTVDAVITYTDPGGGITGTIDGYNGNFGTDLSGSVLFQYGTGLFNTDAVRWNRDMTAMINKYWLYGGPRIESAADPAGDQHWCFNVQGFDTGLVYPPGGRSVNTDNTQYTAADPNNPLGNRIYASRLAYDVRMRVDIMDAYDDDCIPGFGTVGRDLYRRYWQMYSWLAAQPRDIIHITPTADSEIGCFGIGDLVHVEAVSDVRGGFSGAQRVHEYTISWDATPSVLTLSEIQTSSDAEIS